METTIETKAVQDGFLGVVKVGGVSVYTTREKSKSQGDAVRAAKDGYTAALRESLSRFAS
jgi:hypothetical protein